MPAAIPAMHTSSMILLTTGVSTMPATTDTMEPSAPVTTTTTSAARMASMFWTMRCMPITPACSREVHDVGSGE